MTKAELGTKRTCPNCGTRYYDLNRSPIICPHCGTKFEVAAPPPRARAPQPKPVPVPEVEVEKEEEDDTFLAEEDADDDVEDIIGDVDEEER